MAAIAVVLDHTTAAALYDPKDPFNEAVAAFYVQTSGGLGDVYAPVLSLTAGDAERPGLLSYIKGLRFIHIEAFDTDAAVTATELLRFGHSWAAVHAIHAARPSATHPTGRFLLTLTPKAYAGTGVQAVHPGQ
ncbi:MULTISPECIES: PIN domain-containing protein [Streptomyces]|uniref:PIN domain-containing protein n=1 Tax=Streptomyces lannensis TaxID=766498 RepID=A0ABP7KX39_9ACTN